MDVSVAGNVGCSEVNVIVEAADGVACTVFCWVSPAITVCAAAVLITPVSGVEMAGKLAQATLTNNNAAIGI